MAESPDVDFRTEYSPAYPEVQCPSTPGPQLSIKSPELSTSSSSEETEAARGDGTQSPPPNCAICLGRCRNKCFTDSCMHQFCFKCLLEWSKVKPECPLCKQTFKAIIHNVKSIDQFEEYLVQQPVPVSPNPDAYAPFTIPAHLYPRLPSLYSGRVNLYMDDLAMNTLDLTGTSSSTSNANQDAHRPAAYARRILPGPAQLLDMYSQETIQGETGSGSLSQLWRRYVYDRKLYALPMPDITGRLRESSARFYRDNPSQIHRLMPWINRDIVCLLRNTEHDVSAVMEQINGMLMTCNILSPEFRRRLQPFLGTKTVHFIHELNNFARSPFDMIGYDRVVQYSTNNVEEIVIEFSSTSSADSDVESVNVQQEASTSRRGSQQPNVSNTANSGGGFNLYTTTTTSTSSQASAINLSTHNRGANGEINVQDILTTATVEVVNTPTVERPTNIVLSSTSSDECEFVLEQKPPHLRTPEMVSLNSDTDSDVVFVQETKTTPMPSGIAKWASTNSARVRRAQRRRANLSLVTHSFSTSNSDTDSHHYGDSSTPKKLKLDGREENAAVDSTASSAAIPKTPTDDQTIPKVKEEFNQGASTSTGLQSRYRSTRPYIIRSRPYRHYTETSDSDEVEDSNTSSASYLTSVDSNSTSDSDTSWSKTRRNSNKQSLKRSRQQKLSSSRTSRRQLSASAKSKRGSKRNKNTKIVSSKSSSSTKKKKTTKRSRRKSIKNKTTRRKRRSTPIKHEVTSEEQQLEDEEEELENILNSSWTCTVSSPNSTVQHQSDGERPQTPPPQLRSSSSSPVSNSTSDANDTTEGANPSAPVVDAPDSLIPSHTPHSPSTPPLDNPNANLFIYSDTD